MSMLAPSQMLHLIPEPTNEYDPRAIKIIHPAAGKLGYIPKESTESIHSAWANGFDTDCSIREVIPGSRYDKVIVCVQIDCKNIF
jgi:hypothetical protein